jgi:hypothetical protein
VQVDGDLESLTPQRSSEGDVVAEALESRISGQDNDLVQIRVVAHDGGGRRFHDICDVRFRVSSPQRAYQGSSEYDIAKEAQANQQDPHP